MDAKPLFDGVIDAVIDKSPMCGQTSLRKTGCAGGQHHDESIVLAEVYRWFNGALAVQQTTVAEIGNDDWPKKAQIVTRPSLFEFLGAVLLQNQGARFEETQGRPKL